MRKNPIVLGIVNAVIPGLGYVLLGQRKVFGWLLLAGSISVAILAFVEPAFMPTSMFISTSILGKVLEALWYLFFILAYGYDAYDLGRAEREAKTAIETITEPKDKLAT